MVRSAAAIRRSPRRSRRLHRNVLAAAGAPGDVSDRFDIAIVGAGVVGCAIARELSRYALRTVLIEARSDLGDGVSKGNSAVLSTGADTPFGTLECRLVARGHQRYLAEAPAMGLPVMPIGSLTVAWNETERERLEAMHKETVAAGFHSGQLVGADEIYRRVPHLSPGAVSAIWEPEEGIVDPFSTPYAYALDAVTNGVEFRSTCPVERAERRDGAWHLHTPKGEVVADTVINCGGLAGARIDAMAGYTDFVMRPRRGQFIVFDKSARPLLDVVLKPVPAPTYRGILMTPTVFGNILVGPTSEEIEDPDDWRVTREGLDTLVAAARKMLPRLLEHEVTATYCGIRPGTERPEYRIIPRPSDRWLTVGGIRSTGLSASLGIAEHVAGIVVGEMTKGERKLETTAVRVPSLAAGGDRPWLNGGADDAAYREIICHCEGITVGEVRDALASPLPPQSLKALKRRTRVMFGRCQGFFCGARVQALFDRLSKERPQ
ncbi:MAG: FAD/NAD(P)-binding oxidoreductase [Alphaproteobacteria bacterium]|nr:FAD/NAD(P)-binding oxidoreductase [Alphaproteobacteria bacterium]